LAFHGQDYSPEPGFHAFPGKIEGGLIENQLEIILGPLGLKVSRAR
jgi:hypothetical protein